MDRSRIRAYIRALRTHRFRQVLVVEGASLRQSAEAAGRWLATALEVRYRTHRGAAHAVYVSDHPSTPYQKCRAALLRHLPPPSALAPFSTPWCGPVSGRAWAPPTRPW